MSTLTKSQGLLFSEPSFAETGVWCQLAEGIDPAEWAGLCRFIGNLSPQGFHRVRKGLVGECGSLESRYEGMPGNLF